MDLQLAGQRALVFGSSSGLGRELAKVLAAEGARVVVTSRDTERGESAKNYAAAENFVVGDLTVEGDAATCVGSFASSCPAPLGWASCATDCAHGALGCRGNA